MTDSLIDGDFEKVAAHGAEFVRNMAEAIELWQKIAAIEAGALSEDGPPSPDPFNALPTFVALGRHWMDHPQELTKATLDYWQAQGALWQKASLKFLGTDSDDIPNLPNMPEGGKRFAHPQWSENPGFEYLKQSYLLASDYVTRAVETARNDMDPREGRKAAFLARNMMEAMNPANFAQLNPEVWDVTLKENGANLVRGLKMMLEDVERGKGKLLIRQTDMNAFEVGRDMAVTPGQVVWENNILQLIQYAPSTEKVHEVPLLIAPPWINKFYVLDLNAKKSLVKWLVAQGYTVFIISWVNPDAAQMNETWESYMQEGLLAAVDKVREETGQSQVNVAAYCVGGTLTGTTLAWMGKTKDKRIASATFFTAQLDFDDAGDLQTFVDEAALQAIEKHKDKGYLPAESMAAAFNMLRSSDLIWSYVVSNYMLGKEPFPFDLLYWNADSTAMPARVHHFYLDTFYHRNAFARGELTLLGEKVTLADIKVPVYHVAAREDHIAPAASVYRGAKEMKGSDLRYVLAGSGHIAGVVNPPDKVKYQYWINEDLSAKTLDKWIEGATEHPGSWWPDWDKWLAARSGKKVPAREPGTKIGRIEPAPGRYVKVRFDKRNG